MLQGWKTLIFGAVLAAAGFAQQFDWTTVIPANWTGLVVAGIGGVVMLLRVLTSTPIGVSK